MQETCEGLMSEEQEYTFFIILIYVYKISFFAQCEGDNAEVSMCMQYVFAVTMCAVAYASTYVCVCISMFIFMCTFSHYKLCFGMTVVD